MRQLWRHLGFLHWPVDHDAVSQLLPPGLEPDTFGGLAYLGIVPFTIALSRSARFALPLVPKFHELNLRTYVHRNGRSPGVWFFSLDAASHLAVVGARLTYGLPYFYSRMSMQVTGDPKSPTIVYESRRRTRNKDSGEFRGRYGPAGPAAPACARDTGIFPRRALPTLRVERPIFERGSCAPRSVSPAVRDRHRPRRVIDVRGWPAPIHWRPRPGALFARSGRAHIPTTSRYHLT